MNKEKVFISFAAALIGLLVAVGVFFLYQKTKAIAPGKIAQITATSPSPSPKAKYFLTISNPKDESVTPSASVKVTGETSVGAKIVIVTQTSQQSVLPTSAGSFSASIGLDSGENVVMIIAVMPNGEILTVKRTVTVSSEDF